MTTATGTLLKKAREKKDVAQAYLSNKMGFNSPQYISNIERGISYLPAKHVGTISRLLNIPPKVIIETMTVDYVQRLQRSVLKLGRKKKRVSRL